MKLCDFRRKRNLPSVCHLRTRDIRGPEYKTIDTPLVPVFWVPDDRWKKKYQEEHLRQIICDDKLAVVCPYRRHIPRPKSLPIKRIHCDHCGRNHPATSSVLRIHQINARLKGLFKAYPQWSPEGSIEGVFTNEEINWWEKENRYSTPIRLWFWSSINSRAMERDHYTCQDCGITRGEIKRRCSDIDEQRLYHGLSYESYKQQRSAGAQSLEVHHIIPRSRGGSDHPLNLKTLCNHCHAKYTAELHTDLAEERRVDHVHEHLKVVELTSFSGSEGSS